MLPSLWGGTWSWWAASDLSVAFHGDVSSCSVLASLWSQREKLWCTSCLTRKLLFWTCCDAFFAVRLYLLSSGKGKAPNLKCLSLMKLDEFIGLLLHLLHGMYVFIPPFSQHNKVLILSSICNWICLSSLGRWGVANVFLYIQKQVNLNKIREKKSYIPQMALFLLGF